MFYDRAVGGDQVCQAVIGCLYVLPPTVIKARFVPAGLFQPRIVNLSDLGVRFADRPGRAFPVFAGKYQLLGAIGEAHPEL